ncbi:MAG: hypothetical protein FWC62_05445 [Firmicutes bacterium]|nr:hypothetical protein [Bacillota bacterium]
MITIRPGSHTHRLLQLLSTVGEIPTAALPLLGNERVLAVLIHKLESVQDIRFDKNGPVYRVKLIQVSGKKGERTIRLYRKGLPVLDGLNTGLQGLYLDEFRDHCFSNDLFHIQRNHRVAETVALCMAAGVETRPYVLPTLQKTVITRIVPDSPCFYIARDLKRVGSDSSNKTDFTRMTGALFFPGGCYTVYNTRDAVMKWSGLGEVKALENLLELTRMNAGLDEVSAALLLGQSMDAALKTILESDMSRRSQLRFDRIYTRIFYIPLNQNGARLLRMLLSPDWNERLLGALFESSQRSYNHGRMEYDAIVDGRMVLSHLDGDIARLIRFREALCDQAGPADILCYPWQTEFLKTYLGEGAGIRELNMSTVEAALGI